MTVRIYNGALAGRRAGADAGGPRAGTTWSAQAAALAPGQYTAQATQANAQAQRRQRADDLHGRRPAAGAGPGAAGGGSSSQQSSGDRDNDGIPDDQDTSDGSLPPVPGKTFDARVVSGERLHQVPAGHGAAGGGHPAEGVRAAQGRGEHPDGRAARHAQGPRGGDVGGATRAASKTQTADFYDGIFQVKQSTPKTKPKKPQALITDLVLKGEPPRSECAPIKGASAAAAKKKKRGAKSVLGGLWGNGKGKFRTNGKYSSATVRGTIWLTQDRCDGTLTTVKRGTVSVRDFKRRKTVSVKAGHSYLARAASKAKGGEVRAAG